MTEQRAAISPILTFTEEEKRRIHEGWIEAKASQFREIREQYEALEVQIQQIARHIGIDPKELENI
jgi:PHP family Zn ribbon phosphoesterase